MEISIFEVTEYDESLREAAEELVRQLAPSPTSLSAEDFRAVVSAEGTHLFMLREGDRIAGMATLVCYTIPTGRKAWIEDVVTAESSRGKGYGRQLVLHALRVARELGYPSVMLTSAPFRIAANRLYSSMGFEPRETNVYRFTHGD